MRINHIRQKIIVRNGVCTYGAYPNETGWQNIVKDDTEQKKTERLHMLISPDELESIEVWRYANRAGTRAEAVRRLVQIGLGYDSQAEALMKKSERALKALLLIFEKTSEKSVPVDARDILPRVRGGLAVAIEEQLVAYQAATAAYVAATVFSTGVDDQGFAELISQAKELVDKLRAKGSPP